MYINHVSYYLLILNVFAFFTISMCSVGMWGRGVSTQNLVESIAIFSCANSSKRETLHFVRFNIISYC